MLGAILLIVLHALAVNCQLIVAPQHGGNGGATYTIICPNNGVITGIDVRSGSVLDQIKITCTSSTGKTTFGPYGGNGGSTGSAHCSSGSYISAFYGRSGSKVDQLGIRCKLASDTSMLSQTTKGAKFGGSGGGDFDDNSYAIGFRPIAVTIRAGSVVDAIQITYGKDAIGTLCSTCAGYTEVWAPKYGGGGGGLNTFVCPNEGVITGIDVRAGSVIDQIKFTCTSPLGTITTFGPFGGNGGSAQSAHCPTGYYIGSIHGRSGSKVDKLGIRCVKYNQPAYDQKWTAFGGNGGGDFDDGQYALNGKRPVEIRVFSGSVVDSIQIKYGNMPIAVDCSVNRIDVLDQSIVAVEDGFEVIGVGKGFDCSPGTQTVALAATQTVDETYGVETTEGGEFNWATTVTVGYTYSFGAAALGFQSSVSVSVAQTFGGSKSWSTTKSTSTSTGSQNQQSGSKSYEGPGAGLVIGYLRRYKIDKSQVPVRYNFQCKAGSLAPTPGTIKLTSQTFGEATFQNYAFKFSGADKCTDTARSCVQHFGVGAVVSNLQKVKDQFFACFPAGSGTAYKK